MKLSQANTASGLSQGDKLLAEVGGSVRSVSVSDYRRSLDAGGEQTLRETAWGIPLRQTADTHWGTLGNWSLYRSYASQVGRWLVTPNGTAGKLSRYDSSVYADGTPLDETKGNVMVIGPKLYYDVVDDSAVGCPVLWMSESPISDRYLANAGGEYNCYAAYKGSLSSGALVSRSGVAPQTGKTISEFWTAAQVNGSDWGLFDYDGWRWYCMLCMCEAEGNMNIQDILGCGICGDGTGDIQASANLLLTGATSSLGDETNNIPVAISGGTNCSRVNILGVEDFYGWTYEMLQGIYGGSAASPSQAAEDTYIYKGNRIPTDLELASHPVGEYRMQRRLANASGYVKRMALGQYFDLIATERGYGASQTAYWCDYLYVSNAGQLYAVGGRAAQGHWSGPFYAFSYYGFGYKNFEHSARLGYYGNLTLTNGKDIR